jgi:cysteinyl-tRNA synthetase
MRLGAWTAIALALALSACNTLALNSSTAQSVISTVTATSSPLPAGTPGAAAATLPNAKTFAIVLQNVGQNGTVDLVNVGPITNSRYDVVTLDEINTYNSALRLNQAAIVSQMHATAGATLSRKILLAYLDVGEAENVRTYWQPSWGVGAPSFILGADPNGYTNNFAVNYSDPRWQAVVFGSSAALVDQAIADGFDGAFLDNVGAYAYPSVVSADRNAQSDMVTFVAAISSYAKTKNPNFLIVTNDGAGLTNDSRFTAAIDADSEEALFYGSSPTQQGDIQTDSATRAATLTYVQRVQSVNKPVFSIDFATSPNDVQLAYAGGAANRLIEYVTTRSLAALTTTPPAALTPSSARRSLH